METLPEHPYADRDVQRAADTTPLAGGATYDPEWTREDADIIVSERGEFDRADQYGVVYIADNEVIDVSGLDQFSLDGTAVIGGRHKFSREEDNEAGMVVDTEGGPGSISYRAIFNAESTPGHVEGIRIRGPSWHPERAGRYQKESPSDARCWPGYTHVPKEGTTRSERDEMRSEVFSRGVSLWPSGSSVRNCDIHGFTHAGVNVGARRRIPSNIEVTHNQIWSCAIPGLGYPLNIYNGEVLSKYNYYNQYRHSITGFGYGTCGYTTRYDVHGPDALLTPVDMHTLAENGSEGNYTAGKYVHVDHSTFLAYKRFETPGWYSKDDCPAISIRGYPDDGVYVTNCQFLHANREAATDHRNISSGDHYKDWAFSNNEYQRDNWTTGNGAQIDFEAAKSGGGSVSGALPYTRDQRAKKKAQSRAYAENLQSFKEVASDD